MSNQWIWILGLGAITLGGIFLYARSKDEKDPFGYLSEVFGRLDIGETFPGSPLDTNWNPGLGTSKGSSISPSTGESEIMMSG